MSDLVTWLRERATLRELRRCGEAADEIEELRASRDASNKYLRHLRKQRDEARRALKVMANGGK